MSSEGSCRSRGGNLSQQVAKSQMSGSQPSRLLTLQCIKMFPPLWLLFFIIYSYSSISLSHLDLWELSDSADKNVTNFHTRRDIQTGIGGCPDSFMRRTLRLRLTFGQNQTGIELWSQTHVIGKKGKMYSTTHHWDRLSDFENETHQIRQTWTKFLYKDIARAKLESKEPRRRSYVKVLSLQN